MVKLTAGINNFGCSCETKANRLTEISNCKSTRIDFISPNQLRWELAPFSIAVAGCQRFIEPILSPLLYKSTAVLGKQLIDAAILSPDA
jgi:phage host-nuclease inhibitor protein Gam